MTISAQDLATAIGSDLASAQRLLPVVVALVEEYAVSAPPEVQDEAAIRCAGWLHDRPPGPSSETVGGISASWPTSALGALRASGGMGLAHGVETAQGGCAMRRYPQTITVRRRGPSTRNQYGETVLGVATTLTVRANVQPVGLDSGVSPAGDRLIGTVRVYSPSELRINDEFDALGKNYKVRQDVEEWPDHYECRAFSLGQD